MPGTMQGVGGVSRCRWLGLTGPSCWNSNSQILLRISLGSVRRECLEGSMGALLAEAATAVL